MAGPGLGLLSGGRYLFAVPWQGVTLLGTDYAPANADPAAQAGAFLDECAAVFPFLRIDRAGLSLVHHGLVPGEGGADGLRTRRVVADHARASGVPGLLSAYPVKYTTARATAARLVQAACARLGHASAPPPPSLLPAPPPGDLAARARAAVRG